MEGQEHKETKRDRVRRILITPLVQAGMRRQTKMKAPDCEAMLVRLAALRLPWCCQHALQCFQPDDWSIKVYITIGFYNTSRILRFNLLQFKVIILTIVRNTNDISLGNTTKIS